MLRFGCVAVLSASTFLVSSTQTDAAVGVGPFVADSLLEKSVVEPVHYSRRYGWHCGIWAYGHRHKEAYQQTRDWQRRLFGAGGRPAEN